MRGFLTSGILGLMVLVSSQSFALASRSMATEMKEDDNQISQLLISDFQSAKADPANAPIDLKQVTPTNLTSGEDAGGAAAKIADKSFQYWWNNSDIKKSSIGASIDNAQKNLQTQVSLGSDKSNPQKIDMGIDLFQTMAKIKYEGFTKAELFYQARDSSAGVQLSKDLNKNTLITIGETVRSADASSNLNFRWNW